VVYIIHLDEIIRCIYPSYCEKKGIRVLYLYDKYLAMNFTKVIVFEPIFKGINNFTNNLKSTYQEYWRRLNCACRSIDFFSKTTLLKRLKSNIFILSNKNTLPMNFSYFKVAEATFTPTIKPYKNYLKSAIGSLSTTFSKVLYFIVLGNALIMSMFIWF